MCGHAPLLLLPIVSMMFVIALSGTLLAFVQNSVMFRLGMKELAIFSFPPRFISRIDEYGRGTRLCPLPMVLAL